MTENDLEPLCLTVNDVIELPDGTRCAYRAVQEASNVEVGMNYQDDPQYRLITLKDSDIQEIGSNNDQAAAAVDNRFPCDFRLTVVKEIDETPAIDLNRNRPSFHNDHWPGNNAITGRTITLQNQPLPSGKLYHVFFSHCREDRDWVIDMVYRLEAPEYGFRCCFADRDFDLGVPVFQNITKCIHSSKRTVIVLSPEFLESPWCSYETRITMELDMDTRQRLLIPVMLRNCRIPDFIGRLTYMEVQNEHFWERFVAALQSDEIGSLVIQEEVGSSAIMATAPFQFNPNFLNAEEIVEVSVYRHGNFFCKREPTNQMPNELLRHGLQITPGEYVEILTMITKQFYVRCHPFYTKLWLYFFLELFIPAFVMAFLTLIPEVYGTVAMNLYISFSLVCGILTLLIFLVHYAAILQAARYFPDAIESANRIASRKNMMISVKEYGCCDGALDQVSIIFYYYDWRPCLVSIQFELNFDIRGICTGLRCPKKKFI